jgi:hypothetical protein
LCRERRRLAYRIADCARRACGPTVSRISHQAIILLTIWIHRAIKAHPGNPDRCFPSAQSELRGVSPSVEPKYQVCRNIADIRELYI